MNKEEQIKNKLDKIMEFLNFNKEKDIYKCGSNEIIKKELVKILKSFNYEEVGEDWYEKDKSHININYLIKIIKCLEFLK